ncbi:hypothetical protein [Streptomyces sp. CdTB01]|uniref:hypothetical protein n=1 Tax=Streptomyces sp. CdTB01 TaxID=1725411 RepID=UPI00131F1948|nr:hypothetical protein [Streptomyces sp. CdTB01]
MLHEPTYDQELNAVSRGKQVWALFAALAAALLTLQLFTHTAPLAAGHEPETTTSQGEVLVCDYTHAPKETSQHFLTRDRQRADGNASGSSSHRAQVMGDDVVTASSVSSGARPALHQSRPVTGLSPAAIQVFRC